MFLLDTNVISELRRTKPHGAVVSWVQSVPSEHLHIGAPTIGEIQAGIEITREQDSAKAAEIEPWLERVIFATTILPMDSAAFRYWARLMHRQSDTLDTDAMIASIARVHDLNVATRNTRDFAPFGVRTINPFEGR